MASSQNNWMCKQDDINTLCRLAQTKMELCQTRTNLERREAWRDMHSGKSSRPMVLAEWNGVRDRKAPFAPQLQCEEQWAQEIERVLRQDIWVHEFLQDDHVLEPWFDVRWNVQQSDYGVQPITHQVDDSEHLTAKSWDAPITDIARDFHKLRPRTYTVDREATLAWKQHLDSVLGDILPIRIRGNFWWTMGMTIRAIQLIGLQNLMLFMYDDPDGLHQIMQFLCDDHLAFAHWLQQEKLLTLNNENDYIGSGSMGYTRDLPRQDFAGTARTQDLWVLLESQETVGVGPEQFEEFIFPYQQRIAEEFGGVYYGCCEPLHTRWQVVRQIPGLKALSIAPLCNQEIMAEALQNEYVFSRKPNPTLISTQKFDEQLIRADIRRTLECTNAHACRVEFVMKDVHTLNNEPERLARWVQLTREEVER